MKILISTEEKIPQLEQNSNCNSKVIEFYYFDEEGRIIEKSDFFTTKIEEIDNNDKISRSVFFK